MMRGIDEETMKTPLTDHQSSYIKNPVIYQVPYLKPDLTELISVYQTLDPDVSYDFLYLVLLTHDLSHDL